MKYFLLKPLLDMFACSGKGEARSGTVKGLYLTTSGSLRSRLGVGKVLFHRATKLKF